MKKNSIILIGGGGHCKSCIDVIESEGKYSIYGIIDKKENIGLRINDYEIIGDDSDLKKISKKVSYCIITMGHVSIKNKRKKLFDLAKSYNFNFPVIKSPLSYSSKNSIVGEGTILMHGVILNSNSIVGKNCILNTNSLIEHDSKIMDHCHISTGAIVNGGVSIEENCFIGSGAICIQNIKIKKNNFIKANQLIKEDV